MAASSSGPAPRPFISRHPEVLRDFGCATETRLTRRWTATEGSRIHSWSSAESRGGVPFVLVHGLVISSLYMLPLAECLTLDHEVHAVDLPGFGRSEAPAGALTIPQLAEALTSWLAASGIDRCHLVANSLGCQIAAHVAARAAPRIASLTLIGATIDPAAPHVLSQFWRLLWDAFHEPPRLWANWAVDFCRAGPVRAVRTTGHMFRDRIEEQLPEITARTLVVRGDNDPTMPSAWADRIVELLPHGTLLNVPGHAHCVHYSAPMIVAEAAANHAAHHSSNSP